MAFTKEEKFIRVQECALELVASGRESLSVSRLARKTKVSRPWIYKNFGSSQDELLVSAAKFVGERFAELEELRRPGTLKDLLAYFLDGAERTLVEVDKYPWIPKIYFDFLGDKGALGETVRGIESAYRRRVTDQLCQFGMSQEEASRRAMASVKLRMSVSHAWSTDADFRKLGPKAAARIMMSLFDDLRERSRA